MNEQQAFEVIVQALEGANAGQKFSLKDSATVFAALGVLAPHFQKEEQVPGPELVKEEEVTPKGKKK
jgi:hypothetical protein